MHRRLSVHDQAFGPDTPLDDVLAGFQRAGIERVGMRADRIRAAGDGGLDAVLSSGLDVTHLFHAPLFDLENPDQWGRGAARAVRTLDLAKALDCQAVYALTGRALNLDFDEALAAFATAAAPVAAYADEVGIAFLIEPANILFADVTFQHTLRDTYDVARASGIGVCLDLGHCWRDRGLRQTMRDAAPLVGLLQLSDAAPEKRRAYRAVPGEGVIPIERLVAAVLEDGYAGPIDIEISLDEDEDPVARIGRAVDWTDALLDRLGA